MLLEQKVKIKWNSKTKKHYESLGYSYTQIGDEFEIDVLDLQKGSDIKVRYICDYCNGEKQIDEKDKYKRYADYNKYRKLTGKDCCNNKECKSEKLRDVQTIVGVPNGNSLVDMFPEIAKEWNYDKNNKSPHEYAMKSNKVVWWICPKGHEWDKRICDRTGELKVNCPYCSGYRVNETNSLNVTHPDITKEWNYLKNKKLTPHDIVAGSNTVVWWVCKNEHEWETTANHRTGSKTGCPICKESKGEKRTRKWLEANNIYFIAQKEFEGLLGIGGRLLSYDFYLPKGNILIEYQGEFHDDKVNKKYIKENIETQQEHDKRKKEYAKLNNIKLLEIWYWDFDNTEKILESELNNG